MKIIALTLLLAALLPACWEDYPPRPDAGADWYPPDRCGVRCDQTQDEQLLIDAGPEAVDDDAGEDAGEDPDADAG